MNGIEDTHITTTIDRTPNAAPHPRTVVSLALLLLLALLLVGCSSMRSTDPPRTASEQFLLSEAAARAVRQLSTEALRDREVYVDETYFNAPEKAFVVGELRAHLLKNGVRLLADRAAAPIILEVRSPAVGIDRNDYLFGLVSVPLAAGDMANSPFTTTVALPELPLYKFSKQRGIAAVAFVAYWADTGELFAASGPYVGRTRREDYWFFGLGPNTIGDIPPAEPDVED